MLAKSCDQVAWLAGSILTLSSFGFLLAMSTLPFSRLLLRVFLPVQRTPFAAKHWGCLTAWPPASRVLDFGGYGEQLMLPLLFQENLKVKFFAFDSESTQELFRWNEPAANSNRTLREKKAAGLTEALAGLGIRHGRRVLAPRYLLICNCVDERHTLLGDVHVDALLWQRCGHSVGLPAAS